MACFKHTACDNCRDKFFEEMEFREAARKEQLGIIGDSLADIRKLLEKITERR